MDINVDPFAEPILSPSQSILERKKRPSASEAVSLSLSTLSTENSVQYLKTPEKPIRGVARTSPPFYGQRTPKLGYEPSEKPSSLKQEESNDGYAYSATSVSLPMPPSMMANDTQLSAPNSSKKRQALKDSCGTVLIPGHVSPLSSPIHMSRPAVHYEPSPSIVALNFDYSLEQGVISPPRKESVPLYMLDSPVRLLMKPLRNNCNDDEEGDGSCSCPECNDEEEAGAEGDVAADDEEQQQGELDADEKCCCDDDEECNCSKGEEDEDDDEPNKSLLELSALAQQQLVAMNDEIDVTAREYAAVDAIVDDAAETLVAIATEDAVDEEQPAVVAIKEEEQEEEEEQQAEAVVASQYAEEEGEQQPPSIASIPPVLGFPSANAEDKQLVRSTRKSDADQLIEMMHNRKNIDEHLFFRNSNYRISHYKELNDVIGKEQILAKERTAIIEELSNLQRYQQILLMRLQEIDEYSSMLMNSVQVDATLEANEQ